MDLPPIMDNFFTNLIISGSKIRSFLPFYIIPQRYITLTLGGISQIVFSDDNNEFNEITMFFGLQMNNLKKIYGKEYLFTEPQLSFKTNPVIFELKIGLLRKKEYCKRTKKRIMDWPTR